MEVKAISMSDLFKQSEDVYTDVIISARRARQIIDSRKLDLEALENIEDTDDIDVSEEDLVVLEKPMVESLTELLNGELEWRVPDAESVGK
jgi:fructose-1,6-bisphosphatase/sedoheptulose 1,7-bisphosphatase-like protein